MNTLKDKTKMATLALVGVFHRLSQTTYAESTDLSAVIYGMPFPVGLSVQSLAA